MTVAARAELAQSHNALQSLQELVAEYGVRGVNLWHFKDDEYDDQHTYVVEAGPKKASDYTLAYALIRAAGRMPTKFCPSCEQDKDISLFVARNAVGSGLGSICKECNRENVRRSTNKRRSQLQATLQATPEAA
jgi:hypothetical protein